MAIVAVEGGGKRVLRVKAFACTDAEGRKEGIITSKTSQKG
jgi:hypothetical protein